MTKPLELHSRVGADGVLSLRVPLGPAEAGCEVVVRIEPVNGGSAQAPPDWQRFVDETYGSCAGLGLERQDQGTFEVREAIE